MLPVRTVLEIGTTSGLVVDQQALLVRGGSGDPFGRVAPTAPVWRVLLGGADPLAWRTAGGVQHAPGLLVPPEVHIDASVPDSLAILHLDASVVGAPRAAAGCPDVVPLFTTGLGLAELWRIVDGGGLDELGVDVVRELRARWLLPPVSGHDIRVAVGLDVARGSGSISQAAATVGLSRARFRALVREQVGTSPTRLRTWQRLRSALALVGDLDLAQVAATAGFSDQAHLTRTCTQLLGASPGRLRGTLRPRPT